MPKVACVIVTYNRKTLLKRCLDAVLGQSFKPTTVFIVDNACTDGTQDAVKEWGYYECLRDGIDFKYILNVKNEGGAGGFYLGMKTAKEYGDYDAYWVMDDDGEPDLFCLSELSGYLKEYDYIAPIVLSDEDHRSCSFALHYEDVDAFASQMKAHDGRIEKWASPFNGILYSKRLVDKIGYPKREMFIWGDEANYHARCIKAGYLPCTVLKAIHYHPLNRVEYVTSAKWMIPVTNTDWKLYCCIRNNVYNELRLQSYFPKNIYRIIRLYIAYTCYYPKKQGLILDAVLSGLTGNFSRLNKYMKK